MRIVLQHHGLSSNSSPSGLDDDRPLAIAGRTSVARIASLLRARGDDPIARIISSPVARAKQTAELMRDVSGVNVEVEEFPALAPARCEPAELVSILQTIGRSSPHTLVVAQRVEIELAAYGMCLSPRRKPTSARGPKDRTLPDGFPPGALVSLRLRDQFWRVDYALGVPNGKSA